jgi:hypothetical protein
MRERETEPQKATERKIVVSPYMRLWEMAQRLKIEATRKMQRYNLATPADLMLQVTHNPYGVTATAYTQWALDMAMYVDGDNLLPPENESAPPLTALAMELFQTDEPAQQEPSENPARQNLKLPEWKIRLAHLLAKRRGVSLATYIREAISSAIKLQERAKTDPILGNIPTLGISQDTRKGIYFFLAP